jgi:putative component of membrane protein insertase Oxa1/YidC/SpoIIIJ protein YidD
MLFVEFYDERIMTIDRRDFPLIYRMCLSSVIVLFCFYVLASSRVPPDYTKWAFGMIGVVVGYWLK